jgi:hypothetical protein
MIVQELQSNLYSNSFFQNEFIFYFVYYFSILLVNLVSYLYIFVKFYKVMCYSKMTFEWLPMLNPYTWPFSFFQGLTNPYFAFWSKIFPSVRFENSSIEISGIIALEALNSVLYFCVRVTQKLIILLEELEKILNTQF